MSRAASPPSVRRMFDLGRPDHLRVLVMVAFAVAAAAMVVFQQQIRHGEAVLASRLFAGGALTTFVGTDDTVVFLVPGESRGFALQISPECTSAFLVAPFFALGAALLLRRRFPPERVALGVVLAAAIVLLANQLRVATIAGLVLAWGLDRGYQLGHLVVGSLISIVFIALGAFVLVATLASGRARGRHGAPR